MARIAFTIISALLVASAMGDDPTTKVGPVRVPNDSSCAWRGGDYGDVTQCLGDEVISQHIILFPCPKCFIGIFLYQVAIGSCGSGRDPDCDNPDSGDDEYDMILCCPIDSK